MKGNESKPPFKDERCTCPHGVVALGRLHGIDLGKGWVRLDDDPECPVHEYRPRRGRGLSSALDSLKAVGIDPNRFYHEEPGVECVACGRKLTNDIAQSNAAAWTLTEPREPYCLDSDACRRDAEEVVIVVDE